jgi:aspartyl protease family protein
MAKNPLIAVAITCLLLALPTGAVAGTVELQALLGNTAVLVIDGQRKTLKVGESHNGIKLLGTDSTSATLDINGKRETVGLSQRVSSTYSEPETLVVNIAQNARMQYLTGATINGSTTTVLVDTGANMVAISSSQARRMNIPYGSDGAVKVETASGLTNAYRVTLRSINVGGIRVDNVPAMVVSGDYPANVLLGMSFLRHVKIEESNGILSLSR